MCLFTHFGAGALAGGLTGNVWLGAAAGVASHALLDVIPHYDYPDWRPELGAGLGALVLLLMMPFCSAAAVVGGIAGMLPDLENLFQKLGRLRREKFIFPTHTGILRHGRPLGPSNLAVQAMIFVVCFALLALLHPTTALAAASDETGPVMERPVVRVLSQSVDRTVVRIDFPVREAPTDWQAIALDAVRFALPPTIDDLDDGIGGKSLVLPPRLHLNLAVPTRRIPEYTVVDVRWWRDPVLPVEPAELVTFDQPAVFRSVPLAGCAVPLSAGDGILAGMTIEVRHPAANAYALQLAAAAKTGDADPVKGHAAGMPTPDGLLNDELYQALARGARAMASESTGGKIAPDFDPFAATSHWVTLSLSATGLYRVTGQQLAGYGVPVGDIDPGKLRLYRGGGLALEMDPEFPDSLQADRSRLNEVAIEVVGGGDGEWNLDDEIRFYGVGTSAWRDRLEAGAARLDHYDHPYASQAVYWLTWENDGTVSPLPGVPRRVPAVVAPALGGAAVTSCRLRLHHEQQFQDTPGLFADNWAWDTAITSSRTETFTLRTPLAGSTARFVADIRGVYDSGSRSVALSARAWLNGDVGAAGSMGIGFYAQNDSLRLRLAGESTAVQAGANTITVQNATLPLDTKRPLALDSFDILYWTALNLSPGLGQLEFAHWGDQVASAGAATDLQLGVAVGVVPIFWDVSRPDFATALSGTVESGRVVYGVWREPGENRHYVAANPADLLTVAAGARVYPESLLDDDADIDYVVIAASALADAGRDLAAFRSTNLPGVATPRARAVTAEAVYNNFSGGQKDPYALRNYLKRLYGQGGNRLRHVCLLGNASRDFRNYKNRTTPDGLYDLVPTVVRSYFPRFPMPLDVHVPFASDDALCSFDTAPFSAGTRTDLDFPDLACGRLPAVNVAEARAMVQRTIAYAAAPEPGLWRNQVLMTADDVYRPSSGQTPVFGEDAHMREAEDLSTNYLPASVDLNKLYGVSFPFPPSSGIKPAARAAINAALNEGTTIFYYVGHGAEDNLADEQVFQSRDIANLTNGGRRPLFVAFSCDVGVFDSPTRRSMAEQFLQYNSGGAIGAICASQVSWTSYNDVIAEAFFRNQFPGRHVDAGISVGDALLFGKSEMGYLDYRANSQRYNLMGDPALRLPHAVDDLVLAPASLDTLRSGNRQKVVLSASGKALLAPGDRYRLRVEESSYRWSYPNSPSGGTGSFLKSGAAVFVGEGVAGTDDLVIPFKAPSQIRYGDLGRVRLLVESADGDRAAVQTVPAVIGSTGAVDDVRGPDINLAFTDGRFRVRKGDVLTATLTDTSGIAVLGTSPGNSLLLEFDDSGRMADVTSAFEYHPNSYTAGQLAYILPQDLTLGRHRAALHASDSLGNVESDTLSFVVVPDGVPTIQDVTLFPNPTVGPCRLLFDLSDPMTVRWDIYTLAGRPLQSVVANFAARGPSIIEWDGRDAQGDAIANGTYLFVLRGTGASSDGREITKTGKLVMMR